MSFHRVFILLVVSGFTLGLDDWIIRKGSKSSYKMIFGEPSWMFAREKCLAQGADLITFNSQEELEWAVSKYTKNRIRDIYLFVGLTDEAKWTTWIDGQPVNPKLLNWRVAEPIKNVPMYNCAVFDVDKREFFVTSCDIPALERWKVRYICEKYNESLNSTEPVVNKQEIFTIDPESMQDPFAWYFFLNQIGKLTQF